MVALLGSLGRFAFRNWRSTLVLWGLALGVVVPRVPATEAGGVAGVGVAALVMLLTFGATLLAGTSPSTGVGITNAGLVTLAVVLRSTDLTPAVVIGLAVGADYALFVVSRYRAEARAGHAPVDAAGRAAGTAGLAVVFAGLASVMVLGGLAVVNVPALTVAGAVLVAALGAVSLVPALLGLASSARRVPWAGSVVHGRQILRTPLGLHAWTVVLLGHSAGMGDHSPAAVPSATWRS